MSHQQRSDRRTSSVSPQSRTATTPRVSSRSNSVSAAPTAKRRPATSGSPNVRRQPISSSHNNTLYRSLPEGFSFETFPVSLACPLCSGPWADPVKISPCQHIVCRTCFECHTGGSVEDAAESPLPAPCPSCHNPTEGLASVDRRYVEQAAAVRVCCNGCNWVGRRAEAPGHSCRRRQRLIAVSTLARDDRSAKAWFALGASLLPRESAKVQGLVVSKTECYLRCLELNPKDAVAWGNLGTALDRRETQAVSGTEVTKMECYVRALEIDPTLAESWFNLGNNITKGQSLKVKGRTIFKDTAYLRAVELNSKLSAAWYNLGLTLDEGTVIDYGRHEFDASMCFIMALLANSEFVDAWFRLGIEGPQGKTFMGKRWSKKECFAKVVELNSQHLDAWIALSRILKPDETVIIHNHPYSQEECAEKAKGYQPEGVRVTTTETGNKKGEWWQNCVIA